MNIPHDLKEDLVKTIYEEDSNTKNKCIGLTKHLNDIYGEDKKLEKELCTVNYESFEKLKELKKKFFAALHSADNEPLAEEDKEFFTAEELAGEEIKKAPEEIKRDGWWKNFLISIPFLRNMIEETDEEALSFLTDIDIHKRQDSKNFTVEFHFADNNPFFLNKSLSLELLYDEEDDEDTPTEIKGSPIQWKDGQNFTVETVTKKQKGKNKPKKQIKKKKESFFLIFTDIKADDLAEEDEEGDDEEGLDMDPTGDRAILYKASDVGEFMRDYLFQYMIPHLFGVKVEHFSYEMDEENFQGADVNKMKNNPECKQQ